MNCNFSLAKPAKPQRRTGRRGVSDTVGLLLRRARFVRRFTQRRIEGIVHAVAGVSAPGGELASRSVQEPSIKPILDRLRMKAGLRSGRWSQLGAAPALGDSCWSRHNNSVELPDKPEPLVTTMLLHRDDSLVWESCSIIERHFSIGRGQACTALPSKK